MKTQIYKMKSFRELFYQEKSIGFAGHTYVLNDITFQNDFNYLVTELVFNNYFTETLSTFLKKSDLSSECFMADLPYLDERQEIEHLRNMLLDSLKDPIVDEFKHLITSKSFYINVKDEGFNLLAYLRFDINPSNHHNCKILHFHGNEIISPIIKEYPLLTDDTQIVADLEQHIESRKN